jgi:hypothetical protein
MRIIVIALCNERLRSNVCVRSTQTFSKLWPRNSRIAAGSRPAVAKKTKCRTMTTRVQPWEDEISRLVMALEEPGPGRSCDHGDSRRFASRIERRGEKVVRRRPTSCRRLRVASLSSVSFLLSSCTAHGQVNAYGSSPSGCRHPHSAPILIIPCRRKSVAITFLFLCHENTK